MKTSLACIISIFISCDLLLQVNTVNNTESSSRRVPENEICKISVHISADTCTNCSSLICYNTYVPSVLFPFLWGVSLIQSNLPLNQIHVNYPCLLCLGFSLCFLLALLELPETLLLPYTLCASSLSSAVMAWSSSITKLGRWLIT